MFIACVSFVDAFDEFNLVVVVMGPRLARTRPNKSNSSDGHGTKVPDINGQNMTRPPMGVHAASMCLVSLS